MPELTDNDILKLRRIIRKLDNVRGPGVTNTPDAITIYPPAQRAGPRGSASPSLSIGQYQGMVMTMVSQNQAGWAFCQAVDMGGGS